MRLKYADAPRLLIINIFWKIFYDYNANKQMFISIDDYEIARICWLLSDISVYLVVEEVL